MSRGRLWVPPRPRAEFDPRTVSGLTTWWSAEDSVLSPSGTVYQIPDRARPGVVYFQATEANRPTLAAAGLLGGRPSLYFTGASTAHDLNAPVSQTTLVYEIHLVLYPLSNAQGLGFYQGDSAGNGYGFLIQSGGVVGGLHGGVVVVSDGTNVASAQIWSLRHNPGVGTEFQRNGADQWVGLQANPAAPAGNALIGAGVQAYLGEGLCWNRVLTVEERLRVVRYLARKWASHGPLT